jgi:hypothetical protein
VTGVMQGDGFQDILLFVLNTVSLSAFSARTKYGAKADKNGVSSSLS